jgi:HEAT repeat protein
MDPLSIAVLTLAGALSFALGSLYLKSEFERHHERIRAPWREAAAAARLTDLYEKDSRATQFVQGLTLSARRGRFALEFRHVGNDESTFATQVSIRGLPPGLTLKLESGATRSARQRGRRDVELGDYDFDEEVYIQGSGPLMQAIMDSKTRLRVRSMLGNDISVENGELRAVVPNQYGGMGMGSPLKTVLPLLLEFAEHLVRPVDVEGCLVANARHDPVPAVRQANLLTLAREFPDHPVTRPALLAALADPDDEVRLRVATLLVPEGTPVLMEMAGSETSADSCAGRAVAALGNQLPMERTLAILAHALRARRLATAAACLAALGRSRPKDALGTLAKVLARESGPLAEKAARALGEYAEPEAESALIAALEHQAAPVRLAAAEVLGASGSVAAVEWLRRVEADRSQDGTFRRAVRQSIAAIQSRAGTASPGQLTLAEGESGRLSLEDDAAGHVSLAPASEGHPRPAGRG